MTSLNCDEVAAQTPVQGANSDARGIIVRPPVMLRPVRTPPRVSKTYARLVIGSRKMPCWCNRPIDIHDPRVTRAIIVIHGQGRNAEGYFDRINDIIPPSWADQVMVLAPFFQTSSTAAWDEYHWNGNWREGGASGGISSFAVVDTLVGQLRGGNFPNLKWVVICGHSAGGQFTQRYAAFTDIDLKPAPNSALIKFVPANPSSFVYLNEFRAPNGDDHWTVPEPGQSARDGYNAWKYGLTGLYGYAATRGPEWARHYLPLRNVELLAGTLDVADDHGLDTECGAEWQGPFRYQRAHIFNAFMDRFYAPNNFTVTDVPGVGHDSRHIFASPQGLNAIFFAD